MMTALPRASQPSCRRANSGRSRRFCVKGKANLAIIVSANASTRVKPPPELWPTNFNESPARNSSSPTGTERADWRWDASEISRLWP